MLMKKWSFKVTFLPLSEFTFKCTLGDKKNTHNVACRRTECICKCLRIFSFDTHIDTSVANKFAAENKNQDFLPLQIYIFVGIQTNFLQFSHPIWWLMVQAWGKWNCFALRLRSRFASIAMAVQMDRDNKSARIVKKFLNWIKSVSSFFYINVM